ncbi:YqgE/AlgH family protein [Motiliproteus sp. SC1-56]|uniref:YqgE/AlgH family protein n=1 Tax=Motiliproteus sp. SC1-56 TaxID=2799565 RepID=UPI001F5E0148|nr:YqgE/AlgH family protein [Motiliproteus sp. SC1-56]
MNDINLRDHFLISMPHLNDGNFSHTLTYICDHSDQGAMGLVINRPMELSLKDILGHLEIDVEALARPEMPVYAGGPVQGERGFVLHRPCGRAWNSTYEINADLHLTTSLDILEAIGAGKGPDQYLIALGYAGWGAGQLEQEMSDNAWLSCPADLDIIFATAAPERLEAAASKLGVNLDLLTSQSGHG